MYKFNKKDPKPCPLCNSNDLTEVSNIDRNGNPLKTDMCQSCGHVFSNPPPKRKDLELFYKKNYRADYKGTLHPKKKHILRSGQRAIERYKQIKPYLENKDKILEIGSGSGEFLFLLQEKGYTIKGVEPNVGFAEFSRKNYNLDILVDKLEKVSIERSQWDFIFLYHVLEHLLDPIESLKHISGMLSQDGFLNLEVPNIEAKFHSPKRLFHFAHLHNFSLEGLVFSLNKANLGVIKIKIMPKTEHINIICKKKNLEAEQPKCVVVKRINKHLLSYNTYGDILSFRPYRRFFDNFKRPIKEYFNLMALGYSHKPPTLLRKLFKKNNL